MPIPFDMTTQRGCVAFLLNRRRYCRLVLRLLEEANDANRRDRRLVKKCRESKNPFLIRRAERFVAALECREKDDAMQGARDLLVEWGRELMMNSSAIDAAVPQSLLLDLLNVNPADRRTVSPDDGIAAIAFACGLEDSAMYRDADWKQGPLAQAVSRFMNHELLHNEHLKQAAHEHLFGKGGMFEFLPTYRMTSSGRMERQPPKLRLADECDRRRG